MNKNNFELFIKNNFSITKTMFHVNETDIEVIDSYTRVITKNYNLNRLYNYIPIVQPIIEEILKDLTDFKIIINENYNNSNKTFTYHITFDIDNFKDIYAFVFLSQDRNDKNKINISVNTNKDHELACILMTNHYKNNHLENQLKPLIANLSHHSLALNII